MWYGNAAKNRIVATILERGASDVLDFGAGDGAGWAEVLAVAPTLRLACYEPDPVGRAALERRLAGRARLLDDGALGSLAAAFDVVVSLSVLEHVRDRGAYLATAHRVLRPNGTFWLNYDDGHFRHVLNLAAPETWLPALASAGAALTGSLRAGLGRPSKYLRAVDREEIDRLVRDTGFRIVDARYENLDAMKRLSSLVPATQQAAFVRLWRALEDGLNAEGIAPVDRWRGDDANLWRVCPSRTLELALLRTTP